MPSPPARKSLRQRVRIAFKRELSPQEMVRAVQSGRPYLQKPFRKETALGYEDIKYSSSPNGIFKIVDGVRFPQTHIESKYTVVYHYTPEGKLLTRKISGLLGERSKEFKPAGSFLGRRKR